VIEVGEGRRTDCGSSPRVPCGSPKPWVSPVISYLPQTHMQPHAHPKSIGIGVMWPTSLVGGERPGGNEFVLGRPEKDKRG